MDINTEIKRQMNILTADTAEVIPAEELEVKLKFSLENNKPLRVKMGIDPTSPDVHLGHMVVYRKMREFQNLGHKAVLILGDYTARIGDPTGRNIERPPLTEEEVHRNSETYTEQIFKIVDRENTEVHFQSSWFDKVSLGEMIHTSSSFSVAQMLTHETFRKRLDSGNRLSLHELLYPVLQAWDSVFIQSDVELGGTDQKFNILCGRDLQKDENMSPQVVILMPLLMGIDGKKMSKSMNNHIPVLSTPDEKFGRLMSIRDELMVDFFTFTTKLSHLEIQKIKSRLNKENPRDLKLELAREIITLYHNKDEALRCEEQFINTFSKKMIPDNIPQYNLREEELKITAILKEAGLIDSISEGIRLIKQGGLKIDDIKMIDPEYVLSLEIGNSVVIKAGKRRFLKILRC